MKVFPFFYSVWNCSVFEFGQRVQGEGPAGRSLGQLQTCRPIETWFHRRLHKFGCRVGRRRWYGRRCSSLRISPSIQSGIFLPSNCFEIQKSIVLIPFFCLSFLQDLYCVRSDLGNLLKALGRLDEAKVLFNSLFLYSHFNSHFSNVFLIYFSCRFVEWFERKFYSFRKVN